MELNPNIKDLSIEHSCLTLIDIFTLVLISISANLQISLMALGALLLKAIPCTLLAKWIVQSLVDSVSSFLGIFKIIK